MKSFSFATHKLVKNLEQKCIKKMWFITVTLYESTFRRLFYSHVIVNINWSIKTYNVLKESKLSCGADGREEEKKSGKNFLIKLRCRLGMCNLDCGLNNFRWHAHVFYIIFTNCLNILVIFVCVRSPLTMFEYVVIMWIILSIACLGLIGLLCHYLCP